MLDFHTPCQELISGIRPFKTGNTYHINLFTWYSNMLATFVWSTVCFYYSSHYLRLCVPDKSSLSLSLLSMTVLRVVFSVVRVKGSEHPVYWKRVLNPTKEYFSKQLFMVRVCFEVVRDYVFHMTDSTLIWLMKS